MGFREGLEYSVNKEVSDNNGRILILDVEIQGKPHLGYVYTGSDMFRSVWDQIHSGTDPLCLHGTGSKLERYGST